MQIDLATRPPLSGMSAKAGTIPVLAAPMIDPGRARVRAELPEGLTIAEIIEQVLPGREIGRDYLRVALVTDRGSQIVPPAVWHRAKPHAGVHVVIRVVPGKDALRQILQVVVSIAAVAIGAYFAPALAGVLGISEGFAQGIIGLGVSVLGNLLINALVPPPKPNDEKQQNRYTVTGWKNRIDPNGAMPFVIGQMQMAPVFASMPHSEVVGDFLFNRSLFLFSPGEVLTDNYCIGDTSLSEYQKVQIEPRDGVDGDGPVTLFPRQRVEESVGAELLMEYPRDEFGEIVEGSTPEEMPVTRATGADASGASVIIAWPAGLFRVDKKKGKLRDWGVVVRIEQRLAGVEEWQLVETLSINAQQRESFFRQHTWSFPSRGRWEIRCTMMTPENTDMNYSQRTSWAALQTIRPEYPLNYPDPLALAGIRIKSTHQLQGQLDSFNARTRRVCLDWDHVSQTWIRRPNRNPASAFRLVLQDPANARRVADAGIDLEQLQDWHDFCRINNLKYDRVIEDVENKIGELLSEIAAAGRATKRHDGIRWGVVIDRPREMDAVDEFSARNSYGFKVTRSYVRRPDAFVVNFLDETNDNKPAQRIVPWLGHSGPVTLTETLELPGKTDPAEIYRAAYRRMLEIEHRPDVYRLSLDGPITTATRGDKVNVSADVIESTQVAARVRTVSGLLIELDELVTMDAGQNYAIQFRVFADDDDAIGMAVVRSVVNRPGETSVLVLTGSGSVPRADDMVHFGLAGKESYQLIVTGIEAGEDFSCHLKLIDAAPQIDDLLDAVVVPAWSGRVGAEIDENLLQPDAPVFTLIASGVAGTEEANLISFLIEPGPGPIVVAKFRIDHKLAAAPAWSSFTIPAANGGGTIDAYVNGAVVQLRAAAISADEITGPVSSIINLDVGGNDVALPSALDETMITVGALLGGAVVQFSTSDDAATFQVQIYRSTSNVLNRATDAVGAPIEVMPSRPYSVPIGDTTRQNLILNGLFDSGSNWTLGTGWTIGGGKAAHAAGTTGTLSQAMAAQAGRYYRVSYELSAVTAGSFVPRLIGGTIRNGTVRSANGTYTDRIQAVSGNDTFGLVGDSAFVGSVDTVVAYLETATCLAQGTHYIWLETQNEDGVPGPVVGPFSVTIR